MKQIKVSFFAFSLIFLSVLILLNAAITTPQTGPVKNFKFVNVQWFDGNKFQKKTFYSVGGVLSDKQPQIVNEVVNLEGRYVVPPFGDAHNHYIAGPHNIDTILLEYLKDGNFYAKNPASIYRDTSQIKDKINKPESVDVVFSNASITASGGHPVKLYEVNLRKVKKARTGWNF